MTYVLHRKHVLTPLPICPSHSQPEMQSVRLIQEEEFVLSTRRCFFVSSVDEKFHFFSPRKLFYFLKNMEIWSWDISEPEQYKLPCKSIQVPWEVLKTADLLSVLGQNQPHKVLLNNMKFLRSCGEFKVEEGSGERKEMTKWGQFVSCESSTWGCLSDPQVSLISWKQRRAWRQRGRKEPAEEQGLVLVPVSQENTRRSFTGTQYHALLFLILAKVLSCQQNDLWYTTLKILIW